MTTIRSACPNCSQVADRDTYDVGSGPELSCSTCEWCWGAEGQALQPIPTLRMLAADARAWPDGHPCRDCGQLSKDHPTEVCSGWR